MTLQIYSKIPWCTSHYRTDYAKEKAKELREQGYTVSFNSYVKENGYSYCKIYLTRDINYYVLNVLKSIRTYITHAKMDIQKATNKVLEELKLICKTFQKQVRVEYDGKSLFAIIDNKTELSIKI